MTRKSETGTPVVASPLNDEIALSLGRMMMRFSSLEAMMRWAGFRPPVGLLALRHPYA
jgi:hypothetical protein